MVMATPMALYASTPSSVCSTPHACQSTNSSLTEYDMHPRPSSTAPKPIIGGLSCLFASPSIKHSACLVNDGLDSSSLSSSFSSGLSSSFSSGLSRRGSFSELGSLWHGSSGETRCEDLTSHYTPLTSSSLKLREQQSPVSVFQGPVSCNSSPSKSPPGRNWSIPRERSGNSQQKWEGFKIPRDGSFSLVRSALGSSIDCEPISLTEDLQMCPDHIPENPSFDEQFTFNLEGSFVEAFQSPHETLHKFEKGSLVNTTDRWRLEPYVDEILRDAQRRHEVFRDEFVVKAFYEAEKAHRGQVRASGDPYLTHCVETAMFLASIGSSKTVVAAGLLHDTLDDTPMDYKQLYSLFGKGVAELVEGVSRLSKFSKLARDNNTASKTVEADRLHTMFLAMVDVRVVLIKLADRLHNMMTLEALPYQKQQRFAKETLEIFAPLANRLGISNWKAQLENLCFKHLIPQKYHEISSKVAEGSREATIMSAIKKLDEALRKANIPYYVLSGRPKSLYSIHKKMLKKKLSIDEIHDLRGLRLIVLNEDDCYAALQIVHELWPSVPGKLKDYINKPKFNGYQSLHTVVCSEDTLPLEVQIRTKEMHQSAEFGLAAHWRYKEADSKHSSFILQMVEWARWLITWHNETMDIKLRLARKDADLKPPYPFPSHKDDCPHVDKLCGPPCSMDDPIFVIMVEDDKMTVQELPPNSTVKDLLEKMSNCNSPFISYGVPIKEELRPRLNHETVSDPNQKLKMGDLVELSPSIPDEYLTEYREEIRRMFGKADGCKNEQSEILRRKSQIETVPSYV